jgi:hypothetical protein
MPCDKFVYITVKKAKRDAGRNMYGTENSVIHVDLAARSILTTDFSDRPM